MEPSPAGRAMIRWLTIGLLVVLVLPYAFGSLASVHAKFSGVSCHKPVGSMYCFWSNQDVASEMSQAQPVSSMRSMGHSSVLDETEMATLGILSIAGMVLGLAALSKIRNQREFQDF